MFRAENHSGLDKKSRFTAGGVEVLKPLLRV